MHAFVFRLVQCTLLAVKLEKARNHRTSNYLEDTQGTLCPVGPWEAPPSQTTHLPASLAALVSKQLNLLSPGNSGKLVHLMSELHS